MLAGGPSCQSHRNVHVDPGPSGSLCWPRAIRKFMLNWGHQNEAIMVFVLARQDVHSVQQDFRIGRGPSGLFVGLATLTQVFDNVHPVPTTHQLLGVHVSHPVVQLPLLLFTQLLLLWFASPPLVPGKLHVNGGRF